MRNSVAGTLSASQDRLEYIENAHQSKRLAASAILAKPGQLVYIPRRWGRPWMLPEMDKKVILALQRDLEICPRPFVDVAESLGERLFAIGNGNGSGQVVEKMGTPAQSWL